MTKCKWYKFWKINDKSLTASTSCTSPGSLITEHGSSILSLKIENQPKVSTRERRAIDCLRMLLPRPTNLYKYSLSRNRKSTKVLHEKDELLIALECCRQYQPTCTDIPRSTPYSSSCSSACTFQDQEARAKAQNLMKNRLAFVNMNQTKSSNFV